MTLSSINLASAPVRMSQAVEEDVNRRRVQRLADIWKICMEKQSDSILIFVEGISKGQGHENLKGSVGETVVMEMIRSLRRRNHCGVPRSIVFSEESNTRQLLPGLGPPRQITRVSMSIAMDNLASCYGLPRQISLSLGRRFEFDGIQASTRS
ncbi:hypothetical protein RRG08_000507 [Elysia crispata]|uniref:Uncharacterized protein n=1 Tax=Elysia crispata TaxID=231223 RepID=A0AAE0YD11_9GAST|nr:hypothetical protein RRG08_000507 [Elysia crispata]